MNKSFFLDPVQILIGPKASVQKDAALIIDGCIEAFGKEARKKAEKLNIKKESAPHQLLAPPLVDCHSILEEPINDRHENIKSLINSACNSGYGQIGLLPRAKESRDTPEKLMIFSNLSSDIKIHLWANFSKAGKGEELSAHADLIKHGAIGLSDDDSLINLSLINKGLNLGEIGDSPILLAPRDKEIQGQGIAREGVETLRAGWMPDPKSSETLPLQQIIELNLQHPNKSIRVMNISTEDGVIRLKNSPKKIISSVCWWHLISDITNLSSTDLGWRVSPSLGGANDRKALINGIKEGVITAIAVHSIPLDEEELQRPIEQMEPGISGHHLALPALWKELIVKEKMSIESLWSALSFGPSSLLKSTQETLEIGSRRWILYDPNFSWQQSRYREDSPNSANQPWEGQKILGKVIKCGLKAKLP